jgi:hypothetical protein
MKMIRKLSERVTKLLKPFSSFYIAIKSCFLFTIIFRKSYNFCFLPNLIFSLFIGTQSCFLSVLIFWISFSASYFFSLTIVLLLPLGLTDIDSKSIRKNHWLFLFQLVLSRCLLLYVSEIYRKNEREKKEKTYIKREGERKKNSPIVDVWSRHRSIHNDLCKLCLHWC